MRAKPKAALVQKDLLDSEMDVFITSGAADAAARPEKVPDAPPVYKPEPTVQKLFRLRWDTAQALKTAAQAASIEEGRRVTETEIVEQLLRRQLRLPRR